MAVSDAQKKANRRWDQENMTTLGCKIYRSYAEMFKEYATERGTTSNTLLKDYVMECIKNKSDENNDTLIVMLPRTKKEKLMAVADSNGESLNDFINKVIDSPIDE